MNIDFSKPILSLTGEPVRISETDILTLKSVATGALLSAHPDDAGLPGEEKARRFNLALSIERATASIDIKVEDVAIIKKLVGRDYAPLVVGRAYELLEKCSAG